MFENDPEMQEMVRKADAEPTPERKPIWWQIVQGVMMLVGVGAAWGLQIALGTAFHPLVPISGALAGGVLAMGVFGHRPGRYRIVETDEKLTMWVRLPALWRAGACLGPVVLIAGALALANADADSKKPPPAAKPTAPAAPTKPVGKK